MPNPITDTPAYGGRATIHFHPGRHYYTVSVPELQKAKVYQPGVTTILKLKDKSGPLQWWTAEMCEQYGMLKLEELEREARLNDGAPEMAMITRIEVVSVEFVRKTFTEMKHHFKDVLKDATDVGKLAHDYLHQFLFWREFGGTHPSRPTDKTEIGQQSNAAIDAGLQFYNEHDVKPITMETPVWSPTYGYIGTDDFIGRIDGEMGVADYKTSKRIYPEVWLQTAAYAKAHLEEYPGDAKKLKARFAINIGKDGHLDFQRRPDDQYLETDFKAFVSLLGVYHWDRAHGYEPKDAVEVLGPLGTKKVKRARAGR